MDTKILGFPGARLRYPSRFLTKTEIPVLLIILLSVWCFAPTWLRNADIMSGSIDQSIWLLVLLSLIVFLFIPALCWWLLQRFLSMLGLPSIHQMVSQFNSLSLWQQFVLYVVFFALLLLAALGSLIAIC